MRPALTPAMIWLRAYLADRAGHVYAEPRVAGEAAGFSEQQVRVARIRWGK